jgi:hypothetical protein
MGEEKTNNQGVEYFELQCQYLDFDGQLFGAVVEKKMPLRNLPEPGRSAR